MGQDNNQETNRKRYRVGMSAALSCAFLWGILPIYWQALRPIDSMVIILYRVFLAGLVCLIIALKKYGLKEILEPLKIKGLVFRFMIAGILITLNWSIYIWAVNADYVIQTCIGYYIEPLMVCVFGIVFFKEKLTKYKTMALLMAVIGICIILLHFREFPVIALTLAITFATYAAIKKSYQISAILSLLYETVFLAPIALVLIIYVEITGKGALAVGEPYQYGLLLLCGILTAIPLFLFANAANRIPLVSLGLTEYISPSMSLIIGIFLFKEPFDKIQFLAFFVIWIGLFIFTYGEYKEVRKINNSQEIEEVINE